MPVDMNRIHEELSKVIDPELGMSVMELQLIDKLDVKDNGEVEVEFHLTAQFCPPPFAMKIASDIKEGLMNVEGVKSVKVNVQGHYMSDYVNKLVNSAPT